MARGQRKTVEEKIAEKEELVLALRTRLKAEQSELDVLYKEKRDRDLEELNQILKSSGLELDEASEILQEYIQNRASTEQTAQQDMNMLYFIKVQLEADYFTHKVNDLLLIFFYYTLTANYFY